MHFSKIILQRSISEGDSVHGRLLKDEEFVYSKVCLIQEKRAWKEGVAGKI